MLLHTVFPAARIWVSQPTWSNHVKVFEQAGLKVGAYPYYDPLRRDLLFDEMLEAVSRLPKGDVVFLQAATHNPTGLDPSPDQWHALCEVVVQRELVPFFDVAFFGFARGLREDLEGLFCFCEAGCDMLIASSLSKSFSLYNERVGALSVVGGTVTGAANAFSHVLHLIRGSYSNPPLHGAALIAELLADARLAALWERDLQWFRDRIGGVRGRLARLLQERGVSRDVEYLVRENGLFTRLDLEATQVERLREEHALYLGGGGQLNVTAIPDTAIESFCDRVAVLLR
jgi:aspartate/tyrosine/aromatic aminotransferase